MGDNIFLGDRNGVRTPMQWSPDRNAGFSRADPQRLYLPPIMDPVYGFEAVNVEAQAREPGSLLNWMRRMLAVRKTSQAFGRGKLTLPQAGQPQDPRLPARARRRSRAVRGQPGALGAAGRAGPGALPRARAGRADGPHRLPAHRRAALPADACPAYGFYWFRLATDVPTPGVARGAPARARTCRCWCCSTAGRASSATAWCPGASAWRRRCARSSRRRRCRASSRRQRWYAAKGEQIGRTTLSDSCRVAGRREELAVHPGGRRDAGRQARPTPSRSRWPGKTAKRSACAASRRRRWRGCASRRRWARLPMR